MISPFKVIVWIAERPNWSLAVRVITLMPGKTMIVSEKSPFSSIFISLPFNSMFFALSTTPFITTELVDIEEPLVGSVTTTLGPRAKSRERHIAKATIRPAMKIVAANFISRIYADRVMLTVYVYFDLFQAISVSIFGCCSMLLSLLLPIPIISLGFEPLAGPMTPLPSSMSINFAARE